jgi:hypothetical protein
MTIEAQASAEFELFEAAREKFDQIVAHLMGAERGALTKTEEFVRVESRELQRRLLEAVLEARKARTTGAEDDR